MVILFYLLLQISKACLDALLETVRRAQLDGDALYLSNFQVCTFTHSILSGPAFHLLSHSHTATRVSVPVTARPREPSAGPGAALVPLQRGRLHLPRPLPQAR